MPLRLPKCSGLISRIATMMQSLSGGKNQQLDWRRFAICKVHAEAPLWQFEFLWGDFVPKSARASIDRIFSMPRKSRGFWRPAGLF
jgi:hypothetical protein